MQIDKILVFLKNSGETVRLLGNPLLEISGFCPLETLVEGSLTWIRDNNTSFAPLLAEKAQLCVVCQPEGAEAYPSHHSYLLTPHPRRVYFKILNHFFLQETPSHTTAPTAVVETQHVGKNCSIGHGCYVGPEVYLEDEVVLEHHVIIQSRCRVGKGSIIHSGAVIGVDGYGFYEDVDGLMQKIPHFGGVEIGCHVEIGANTCIDRGTLNDTQIGDHVKIGNLCYIAHNSIIAANAQIVAMVMLSGSVVMEQRSYIGPGATLRDGIRIGENSLVGVGSAVVKDVPSNSVVAGVPAKVMNKERV